MHTKKSMSNIAIINNVKWGQKNQKSCRDFPNIQFIEFHGLIPSFQTTKKRSNRFANFMCNSSAVIVCRSKITTPLFLVFSTYIKKGTKKIDCLIFFQLCLGRLTCRTNILFQNIFKDICR